MIGSTENSGGVVVGALACGIVADSNLALCFDFFTCRHYDFSMFS